MAGFKKTPMKSLLFTLVIFLTAITHKCRKNPAELPGCIQKKIDQIKNEPKWNPPAEVYEYEYKGKSVYYFTSDCCDQYHVVYDDQCNYMCAPDGGFTGKGDGKCADFHATAKKIRLVWKDPR